jgi:hypothetical protein
MLIVTIGAAVVLLAAVAVALARHHSPAADPAAPPPGQLPHTPDSYLGVYAAKVPGSYAGVTTFARATGTAPNVIMYYSGWMEPFQTKFAVTAASHGAVPLVQIEPRRISLTAIAAGQYDGFLSAYAAAVRAYHRPVILSFGHEMNGSWYSWGKGHSSPAAFVAAWRHIVTLFRTLGARNVTWLWTVNIIDKRHDAIPDPAPWWPGRSYVTWAGIDGYYRRPSWMFAPLFGPTIAAVRALTHDPILIAETGATPRPYMPAKIANLFAGIHAYGLLGFVWYDVVAARQDWRLDYDPPAIAAFRRSAKAYERPAT